MQDHRVVRLWIREVKGGPMIETESITVRSEGGVAGDHAFGKKRHLTAIFADDWKDAERALEREVDPSARRANVLLTGGRGGRFIGSRVRVGSTIVEVQGETDPCGRMDQAAQGLRKALEPDERGGVWGQVGRDGEIRVGDIWTLDD